jgi:hypothetical protein
MEIYLVLGTIAFFAVLALSMLAVIDVLYSKRNERMRSSARRRNAKLKNAARQKGTTKNKVEVHATQEAEPR